MIHKPSYPICLALRKKQNYIMYYILAHYINLHIIQSWIRFYCFFVHVFFVYGVARRWRVVMLYRYVVDSISKGWNSLFVINSFHVLSDIATFSAIYPTSTKHILQYDHVSLNGVAVSEYFKLLKLKRIGLYGSSGMPKLQIVHAFELLT